MSVCHPRDMDDFPIPRLSPDRAQQAKARARRDAELCASMLVGARGLLARFSASNDGAAALLPAAPPANDTGSGDAA